MIQSVVTKLIFSNPYFGNFATRMKIKESSRVDKIEVTYYPQLRLYYNREWFETLNSNEAEGYLLHELLHLALLHPVRIDSRRRDLWSIACDITVNQYIEEKYHVSDWITIEKLALILGIRIKYYQNAEFYYDLIISNLEKLDVIQSKGEAIISLSSNEILKVDLLKDPEVSESELSLLKNTLTQCMEHVDQKSDLSEGLLKELDVYRVNWRAILKRFLSQRGKIDRKRSYKRISRRHEGSPGYIKSSGVNALVALDESGSMSDEVVKYYLEELKEINKITGVNIQVVKFDSTCSEPVPLSHFIKNSQRDRRGGTDFHPVFELANRHKFPLVILFTDGDGSAPESVGQRVLWILTEGGHKPANYGESVYFGG